MRDKNNQPSRKYLNLFTSTDYKNEDEDGFGGFFLGVLAGDLNVSSNNALVIFARLGTWNGCKNAIAFKQETIWSAIELCINKADSFSIYLERGNLKVEARHHDGTNHFVIREAKNSVLNEVVDAIYAGMSASGIAYHTRPIGGDVEKALGIERT